MADQQADRKPKPKRRKNAPGTPSAGQSAWRDRVAARYGISPVAGWENPPKPPKAA